MRDFRGLKVWEKSHRLTLDVYRASAAFPADERYGLTAQLRRAASAVPTNIAEGCGRDTDRDFARFLSIAAGSVSETDYLLLLARDLAYLDGDTFVRLGGEVEEVRKMLGALQRKLTADS